MLFWVGQKLVFSQTDNSGEPKDFPFLLYQINHHLVLPEQSICIPVPALDALIV